ncbi:MAG: CHRD domain-containing protein [Vicinamibacterales bacterium]
MIRRALQPSVLTVGLTLVMAISASAQVINFEATLNGGEETPAPGLNTGAVGTAEVGVDLASREIVVNLQLFNLPTSTTAGHIHAGARGTPGPVILDFNFPAGRTGDVPITFRLGQAAFRARPEIGINTLDDAIQTIVGGNSYVNIHTTQYPAGEIRGQLTRKVTTP